jgi:ABC-type transport system involved in multi-copper enzyme maturation permease subunit
MTTVEVPQPPAERLAAEPGREGAWRVGWRGVRTVAVLELRQRVRSTRWFVVLIVWFAVLAALTLLIRRAVYATVGPGGPITSNGGGPSSDDLHRYAATSLFGIIVFLVLSLGGLVAPALTATSVNGDRTAGVLAALQTTLLTPAEIALGKLAAAWVTALALLATAAPFVIWAYIDGGTPGGRLVTTLAVLALTLLVVCAIGLGWSAVAARTASSTVLTYLSVVFLGIGLPLLFAFTLPLTQQQDVVRVYGGIDTPCRITTEVRTQYHTERSWWLLGANPFVVVADSAPPAEPASRVGLDDPLTLIRNGVREARLGPSSPIDECYPNQATYEAQEAQRTRERDRLPATWPYGLAADLALGAGFTALAVRRLRAPSRRLPRGTRVA